MKKILLSTIYLSALLANSAFAQSNLIASNPGTAGSPAEYSVREELKSKELTGAAVESKIMRSFLKKFKTEENLKWYDDKGYYLASFRLGDRTALAWFSKSGYLTNSVFYGTEKHLPADEKNLVLSNYEAYAITHTQEIFANNQKAWVVGLDNGFMYVEVRLMDGGMEELKRYRKSK